MLTKSLTEKCDIVTNFAGGKEFLYCRTHKVEAKDCPTLHHNIVPISIPEEKLKVVELPNNINACTFPDCPVCFYFKNAKSDSPQIPVAFFNLLCEMAHTEMLMEILKGQLL